MVPGTVRNDVEPAAASAPPGGLFRIGGQIAGRQGEVLGHGVSSIAAGRVPRGLFQG